VAENPSLDKPPAPSLPEGNPTRRRRMRRYLSPLPRYAIVASWGVLLAFATFYLLRKLGY